MSFSVVFRNKNLNAQQSTSLHYMRFEMANERAPAYSKPAGANVDNIMVIMTL